MSALRLVLLALLTVAILAGAAATWVQTNDGELAEVSEAVEHLRGNFIDQEKLDREELNRAAIRGIIEHLDDPYTAYLSPEQYQAQAEALGGHETQFEGIGAEVTSRNGGIMILGPLPGSPAGQAGLRPGDVVLAVNGQSVEGMDLQEVVALIRGPKDTEVTLRLLRAGEVQPIDVSVVRGEIHVTSVSARMQTDRIGYIRLDAFDEQTVERLRGAIERLRGEGAQGLVLDLRNNSGGLLDVAVGVVSQFVESGTAFVQQEADGAEAQREVVGDGIAYDLPLVAITNGFTASAAEIVSGALQDHGRATVVGSQTFGKGSINLLSQLDSGAGLNMTTARWLTPEGRVIEGVGLKPDIQVGSSFDVHGTQRVGNLTRSLCVAFEEDRDALGGQEELISALERLCGLEPEPLDPAAYDEQLDVAVETLRGALRGGV